MKSNKHLNLEERIRIGILYQAKNSIRKIAKELGRSPSTISRELKIKSSENNVLDNAINKVKLTECRMGATIDIAPIN